MVAAAVVVVNLFVLLLVVKLGGLGDTPGRYGRFPLAWGNVRYTSLKDIYCNCYHQGDKAYS